MNLKEFLDKKRFADLYFDLVNCCALVDSGIPFFIVAPPSGGKTTLIKALERIYNGKFFVYVLERFSPMRLIALQDRMNEARNVLFLSEDFSTMGEDETAVFKMAVIISKLAYDKRYIDTFYIDKNHPEGLFIEVDKLGFVCGLQPLWLTIYSGKEVFETLIMEKILRYYRLPIKPIKETESMKRVVSWLVERIKERKGFKPKKELVEKLQKSLAVQCGARAKEYSGVIARNLTKYIPKSLVSEWIEQFRRRFSFEKLFLMRYYEPNEGLISYALHKEYTVLFFAMQYNHCSLKRLRDFVKIRAKTKGATNRYTGYLIKSARECNYVTTLRRSKELIVLPSKKFRSVWLYDFERVLKG